MNCISAVSVPMRYWRKVERRLQHKLVEPVNTMHNNSRTMIRRFRFQIWHRRRYSFDWQKHVVCRRFMWAPKCFRGTSNVHLLKSWVVQSGRYSMSFTGFQALDVRLRNFQKRPRSMGTRISW